MGGNDTLDGGANWDQMYGGSGDDTYITNDYRTDVYESPDEGNDTVMAMKEFILPDNVENIVSIGSSSVYLTGNDLANVITGNNAGDSINGMGGDDTMNGGTGDDTYTVDSVLDVIHDAGGKDLVWAYVDGFVLPAGIENLTLSQGEGPVFGTGNSLDNVITGNSYTNVLFGGDGNDTIYGGAGNDTIDGGNGIDHAVFSGAPPSTFLVRQGNDVVVTSVFDGSPVQVLRNIERIDWGGQGGTYHTALDIDGNAGMAYRLYQAAFDRTPDLGGLGYQMHDLDIGVSLEQVASNFIASPEFQRTYGNVDDTQFLTLLYNNVLHRAPDVGGLQYHLDEFAHGQTRADMLIHFSESPENQANVIGAIQNGMEYVW
jgi:serralysin